MRGSGRAISGGVALLLVLIAAGCNRLNPAWCEEHASCLAGEYCDPSTNRCRPWEAGVSPDRGLDQWLDVALDSAPPDDAVGDRGQEQLPPDLPPKPQCQTPPPIFHPRPTLTTLASPTHSVGLQSP